MRPGLFSRLFLSVALLPHLLPGPVGASPLPATADPTGSSAAPVWAPLTLEQLLRSDPPVESDPASLLLGTSAAETMPLPGESGEAWDERQIGASVAQPSLGEQLRGYVNIERGRRKPTNAPDHRRTQPPPFAGIDLGEAADAWARETVQALLQSALTSQVDERGRIRFSVLGVGDFSLTLADDGSRFVLSEGDSALLIAGRPGGGAVGAGIDADAEPIFGFAQGMPPAAYGVPRLRQALDRMAEVASHPVSLLVYCVFAAYVALWSILSHQKNTPRASSPGYATARAVQPAATASRRRFRRGTRKTSSHSGSQRALSAESGSSSSRYRTGSAESRSSTNPHRSGTAAAGSASSRSRSGTVGSGSSASQLRSGTAETGASTSRRRKRIRIRTRTRRAASSGTL